MVCLLVVVLGFVDGWDGYGNLLVWTTSPSAVWAIRKIFGLPKEAQERTQSSASLDAVLFEAILLTSSSRDC